ITNNDLHRLHLYIFINNLLDLSAPILYWKTNPGTICPKYVNNLLLKSRSLFNFSQLCVSNTSLPSCSIFDNTVFKNQFIFYSYIQAFCIMFIEHLFIIFKPLM